MRDGDKYLDPSRVVVIKVSYIKGIGCIHLTSRRDEWGRDLGVCGGCEMWREVKGMGY